MGFKMNLCAIDFETTGVKIVEKKHQPITMGAILVDPVSLEEIDRMYTQCSLESMTEWTKGAENCHGLSYDYIMEQQSMEDAAIEVFEFFIKNGISSSDYLTLLGHNVLFDEDCLKVWMSHIGVKLRLTHRRVDTFPIGFSLFGTMDSDELFTKIGVVRNSHNALEDAEAALNVVRAARKIGALV